MTADPAISMVIPTYNRAGGYLEQAIDSILAQDYPNLDLTVLDDGSTDHTRQVLEEYAAANPDRFRWIHHENMGQIRTINKGFGITEAPLVGYLNSDDVLLPQATTRLVEAIEEAGPAAAGVYGSWYSIDENGTVIDTVTPITYELADAVRFNDPVVGTGSLMRRGALEQIGSPDPGLAYCWDFDLWVRLAHVGRVVHVDEPLSMFRWHGGQAGRAMQGAVMGKERIAVIDKVYSQEHVPQELEEVREQAYRNAFLGAATLAGEGVNDPRERFYIDDRVYRRISERAHEEDFEEMIEECEREIVALEGRLESRITEVDHFGRVVAEREQMLGELRSRTTPGPA
jgi:glycosyltransferase involved in cell wall biosynthesis